MAQKLVTIARFQDPVEAALARNRLEAAGIKAALSDENLVAMDWLLTNAIGGIKLMVLDSDSDRAVDVLEEAAAAAEDIPAVVEGSTEEVEGAPEEEAGIAEAMTAPGWGAPEPDDPEPILTAREQDAHRAFKGAIFGMLFWPLLVYVAWLLIRVYGSEERLEGQARQRAWLAAAITFPFLIAILLTLRLVLM